MLTLSSVLNVAQTTTTVTGILKDLSQNVIPAGTIQFTLKPSIDTTISGSARFTPLTVTCGIGISGNVLSGLNSLTTTTVGTTSPGTSVTVASTTGEANGQAIVIEGAGVAGAAYVGNITNIVGAVLTISPATTTSVSAGTKVYDPCQVTMNTALTPGGTSYLVDVCPLGACTSHFNFYAINSFYDLTTIVPTPATSPSQNFVDIFSNQNVGGQKNFTGSVTFTGGATYNGSNRFIGGTTIYGTGDPAFGVTPIWLSVQDGTSIAPVTTATSTTPSIQFSKWDSTPATIGTYGSYLARLTRNTGVLDVQSGVALGVFTNSFSTNLVGDSSKTSQVGILSNCTAVGATSDAGCEGLNLIVNSQYVGTRAQSIAGAEVDMTTVRAPGHFNAASAPYAIGYSAVLSGSSFDGTSAFVADTSHGGFAWLEGFTSEAARNFAFGAVANSVTPDTGFYCGNATTYCFLVGGPKSFYPLNGSATLGNPIIGIGLAAQAATSGQSNVVRFISTSGISVEQDLDEFFDATQVAHFKIGGADKVTFDNNGNLRNFGNHQVDGSLTVGGGTPIAKILSGTATLTYTAISAQTSQEQTITISGASTTNNGTSCAPRATLGNANIGWESWVSASNTVSVRVTNPTGGSITPSAVVWGCTVYQ
jgi:hypothetical protein